MTRLTTWACLFMFLCGTASAASIPEYPFVFTSGEAAQDVPPNIAECTLTILALDADPAKAQAVVTARVRELLALLSRNRVGERDVQAFEVDKEAVSNENTEKGRLMLRGYKVTRRMSFKVRDLGTWPDVVSALLGAENIESVQVTFGRTDRQSLLAELELKAAQDAQARGERLARAFARKLGAAVAISPTEFGLIEHSFGLAGSGFSSAFAPDYKPPPPRPSESQLLIPSSITLSTSVNVIFRLE